MAFVQALLTGGPADATTQDVGVRPPAHIDVEITDETPDTPIPPGEAFPAITFTTHRYRLSNVEIEPRTGMQQAKYAPGYEFTTPVQPRAGTAPGWAQWRQGDPGVSDLPNGRVSIPCTVTACQ